MQDLQEHNGIWFSVNTPLQVKNAICHAYNHKLRVRIHLGNTDAGNVWLEEYDVIGRIGRSTGEMKIPLLIKNARSLGGGHILDHCILGIQEVTSKKWLYKANNLQLPVLKWQMTNNPDYPVEVINESGESQARFKTAKNAINYIAFMRGERMKVN